MSLLCRLLTFLSLLVPFALALPSNINRDAPHSSPPYTTLSTPATSTTILVCEHVNYAGTCISVSYTLGSGDCSPLDGTASSISILPGFECTLYKNAVCRDFSDEGVLKVGEGGSPDLTRESGGWNDAARGFMCYRDM